MKRESSLNDISETESVDQTSRKRAKLTLNLEDLGAGYNLTDKRVEQAIKFYESKLLPFINENPKLFKDSNFLSIKGYGTGLSTLNQNKSPK